MPRARLPQLHSITDGSFEPNRKNPILLGDDDVLDTHQKTIKIGGQNTPLSLNKDELRINGDLFLNGKLTSHLIECDSEYLTFRPNNYTRFESTDSTGTLDLYIASGDTYLLTSGDDFYFIGTSSGIFNYGILGVDVTLFQINTTSSTIYLKDTQDPNDFLSIEVAEHGATNFRTTDDGATIAHITLNPDGDLILDPVSQKIIINTTDGLYFDGGGDTYIAESSADNLRFIVGGVTMLDLTESALGVDSVNVNNSSLTIDATQKIFFDGSISGDTYIAESSADVLDFYVGGINLLKLTEINNLVPSENKVSIPAGTPLYFDGGSNTYIKESATDKLEFYIGNTLALSMNFSAAANRRIKVGEFSIGWAMQAATYNASDTEINFLTEGQKIRCTFDGGNITDLNFTFPNCSANFVLLLIQDGSGSRTVTNWKAFDTGGNAANGSATLIWAGGTAPTLTTTADKADIISIFWDAENEKAYAAITHNF
jgi:hypothetical protein